MDPCLIPCLVGAQSPGVGMFLGMERVLDAKKCAKTPLDWAVIHLHQNNPWTAIRELEGAPRTPMVLYATAYARMCLYDLETALDLFCRLETVYLPGTRVHGRIMAGKSAVEYFLGRAGDAYDTISNVKIDEVKEHLMYLRGVYLFELGRVEPAERQFAMSLKVHTKKLNFHTRFIAAIHMFRAKTANAQGRNQAAIDAIHAAHEMAYHIKDRCLLAAVLQTWAEVEPELREQFISRARHLTYAQFGLDGPRAEKMRSLKFA